MLAEGLEWLAQEAYRTKPALRQVASIADRIAPGSGKFVAPIYIGYKGGTVFGTIAGKSAQQTLERGGFIVYAPGSKEIDRYDRSALGSTRIV
tara:strand:+ start:825 stop:1103 length:279 start_codon:yes stop_codon:yes gene_type:complete